MNKPQQHNPKQINKKHLMHTGNHHQHPIIGKEINFIHYNRRATTLFLAAIMTAIFLAGAIWAADIFDITIDLGGRRIFSHSGDLPDPLQTANFADHLNTYLQTCIPDPEGMCDVPLHVTTNRPIKLQGLEVYYTVSDENVLPQNTTNNNSTNNNSTNNNLTNNTQNQAPVADFTFTPGSGTAPITVQFDASQSNDPDGTITEYNWWFNWSDRLAGKIVNYTFLHGGRHDIQLKITDNRDAKTETWRQILINPPPNQAPSAAFSINQENGEAPITIEFDASASNDPDGSIISYSWTFGQIPERTQTGKMTTYTFEQPGEFTVTLTVTDNQGMTSSTQHQISVRQHPNLPPIARFTASPTSGNIPLKVTFDASESSDSDGRIVLYGWDFGDHTQGSGKTAEHTYTQPGMYQVTLAVQDNQEAAANTQLGIEVLGPKNKVPIIASNQHFSIHKFGGSSWFRVDAYDPDGDSLKYAIDGMPRLYHTDGSGTNMVDAAMIYHSSQMFSTWAVGQICDNWYGTLKVSDGKNETKSFISVLVC